MKQTVGGPFQGVFPNVLEQEIVRDLISASQRYSEDPRLPKASWAKTLDAQVGILEMKIEQLISERVKIFLSRISEKLFDTHTRLKWSLTSNSCQDFCNTLLDWDFLGRFLGPSSPESNSPNEIAYLMSFVTRPGSYLREKVKSKFDVPNGLTEEYLLRFRRGRHDESDILDTLQEYWHDWGKLLPIQSPEM